MLLGGCWLWVVGCGLWGVFRAVRGVEIQCNQTRRLGLKICISSTHFPSPTIEWQAYQRSPAKAVKCRPEAIPQQKSVRFFHKAQMSRQKRKTPLQPIDNH